METLIDEVTTEAKVECGLLMKYGEEEKVKFRTTCGIYQETLKDYGFKISHNIVEGVSFEGIRLLTGNA